MGLPQLVQTALNSSHGIAEEQTEIEIMASMASHYAHTKGLKKALQLAESTKPKCMPYIAAIGHYVQKNNGGTSFDTIHVLAHVSALATTYSTWLVCNVQQGMPTVHFYMPSFPNVFAGKGFTNTLTIGEDFMTTIAFMDFKEKYTTFPWTTPRLLAANRQSPICKDGIGKLLHKSDVDKLKTPAMRANLTSCEANLAIAYTTLQKHGLHATTDGKTLFARFLVRSTLYVTKKQHKSREDIQFDILGEISSNFSQELHDLLNGTNTGAPTSSSTAEQEVPVFSGACLVSPYIEIFYPAHSASILLVKFLFETCLLPGEP
jgi:hypothetical protein